MTVVNLESDQLLAVLVQRHRLRPAAQREGVAEEGAQRPGTDTLHQGMSVIEIAQATGGEIGRADIEWCVPTGHPPPVKTNRRANQLKLRPTTMPPVSA